MIVIVPGAVLIGLGVGVFWLARRRAARWLVVVAGVLGAVGLGAVCVYVWAATATDTSQFARTIVWGESEFGDQHRFAAHPLGASVQPVTFAPAGVAALADYTDAEGRPLEQLLADNDSTAFVVLRGDQLLYERYFNGSDHDDIQTSFSVAKSVVATLVGIATDEGHLADLDDAVSIYVPELLVRDERFGEITLRHLMTMSSGLSFEEGSGPWDDPANTYHGTDLRTAVVETPDIVRPPGTEFDYNDWNVILLGLVLERATGMSVSEYATSRLWQPMGAEADGSWSLDSAEFGFEKMFVGVNGRAIDFAKLGWIYLHDGHSGDVQVVSSAFVAEATRRETTTDPVDWYQYLWWAEEDRDAYYANGDHGQFIWVDPATDLVIVRHGRGPGGVDWVDLFADLADFLAAD